MEVLLQETSLKIRFLEVLFLAISVIYLSGSLIVSILFSYAPYFRWKHSLYNNNNNKDISTGSPHHKKVVFSGALLKISNKYDKNDLKVKVKNRGFVVYDSFGHL